MWKGLFNYRLSVTQRICLAGLFIAIVAILQKILAINYIPVIPFLRISLGGPAIIIFSSIFLGPIYGMAIGAAADILGYFIFDPKNMSFFPQITAIYALLGLASFFIFWLFKHIKNSKLMVIIEGVSFVASLTAITLYLFLVPNLQMYSSTYTLELWQKILIPSAMFVLLAGLFVTSIVFEKRYKKDNLPMSPVAISFSCFIIEATVMVLFGTLMKGLAFGFKTYPMILICQLVVMAVNVPLNTWLIILLLRVTNRYSNQEEHSI